MLVLHSFLRAAAPATLAERPPLCPRAYARSTAPRLPLAPQTYAEAHRVIRKTQEAFEAQVPPRSLRARTAAVVLSLVGGARTDQANARLDEAQEWFASAGRTRRGAARHLRELSSAAPAGLIHGAEDQSITRTTREAGQSKEKS